jgi:hydroxyethylthiazole kinase-like uncharacterized protein yjeF
MIELLTTAEMAEADRKAIGGGVPGIRLMENAGRAVAEAFLSRYPPGVEVAVVAGPGNNGGDGFVVARLLSERGYRVRVLLFGERARMHGDAAEAARRWAGLTVPASPAVLAEPDVIVDALFGAGLDRPIEGPARALIVAINAAGAPIVAVDLPSGVNGTSGAVMGVAVRASETVTFFRRKLGHLLLPGRMHCGSVTVADIGIPATVLDSVRPATFINGPELWGTHFPIPRVDAHKYARGHAVVVSGGIAATGAARLAARGALRAGAGLVTIASPQAALAVNAAANLAIMVRPVDTPAQLAGLLSDERLNALVIGPGGGVGGAMRELVFAGLAGPRAVVLDADALTSFAEAPVPLYFAIAKRANLPTILTPHEGEFARLFEKLDEVSKSNSKLEKARAAAFASGAIVLFKGADTVIAAPDGRAAITENAPPWLATAGSGDVLAGMIAGLTAQRMPGFEAACAAAWLHGEAGKDAGPGLIAEDLPEALPGVYRQLFAGLKGRRRD